MNTKQLFYALYNNDTTKPFFDGIYSRDNLVDIVRKPKLIICNTDPINKPGKHWVLFYFENDVCEFYDSLGKQLTSYGKEFQYFAQKFAKKLKQSNIRTQPSDSSLCGQYCLYFAYFRCKVASMTDIIKSMQSCVHIADFVCKKFNICENFECSFLQKSVKYE